MAGQKSEKLGWRQMQQSDRGFLIGSKKDSIAISDKVTSSGVPKTVAVLKSLRVPQWVTSSSGTTILPVSSPTCRATFGEFTGYAESSLSNFYCTGSAMTST